MAYRCWSCSRPRENEELLRCDACNAQEAPIQAPSLGGEIRNHFNAHFDITQGQYFESAEQKKNWLKSKDKEQVEGGLSPRTSSGGRVICTKTQAASFVGRGAKKVKQADIPGINNRRNSPRD